MDDDLHRLNAGSGIEVTQPVCHTSQPSRHICKFGQLMLCVYRDLLFRPSSPADFCPRNAKAALPRSPFDRNLRPANVVSGGARHRLIGISICSFQTSRSKKHIRTRSVPRERPPTMSAFCALFTLQCRLGKFPMPLLTNRQVLYTIYWNSEPVLMYRAFFSTPGGKCNPSPAVR
jgi:hypothetical protein